MALANLPAAAQMGFQSGKQQTSGNALGMFIRGMLAKHQARQASQQELTQDIQKFGIQEMFKAAFRKPEVSGIDKFKKQLWAQAGSDIRTELGYSAFMGLSEKKQKIFREKRSSHYNALLKRFNVSDLSETLEAKEEALDTFDDFNNLDLLDETVW